MPNTPLNPDALANLRLLADRATEEVRHAVIEPDILHKLLDLAAAQPVVNSVEELDALPVGSVVRGGEDDLIGEKIRFSPYLPHWCTTGEEEEADKRDLLPARVLYLPTEELTNGR